MSLLNLLFLITLSGLVSTISGAWTESGTTTDGTNQVILVVEPAEIDIGELNPQLVWEDFEALPYCTESSTGLTPCRNRPNIFTAVDYDSQAQMFYTLTDRGPVVDCLTYPYPINESNVVGQPGNEGYFVSNYAPVLTTFQVDNVIFNYFYRELVDSQDPGYDGNGDGEPDAMDINGDGLPDVNLPLTGKAQTAEAPKIYGPSCTKEPEDVYPMQPDETGLNPSGLRRVMNGEGMVYYIAIEEYGPSILILNEDVQVLKAYVPEGKEYTKPQGKYEVAATLPSILSSSQYLRSFQSLAYDYSTSQLFVFMEATLSEPSVSSSSASSTFIRTLVFDASDLMNLTATASYGFLLDSVQHEMRNHELELTDLSKWSLVAADHIEGMQFLLVEQNLEDPSESYFVYLDLSEASDLTEFYSNDLELEDISGQNNILMTDDQPSNDNLIVRYDSLPRPVMLGMTSHLFKSSEVADWNEFSLDAPIRSLRIISPTVLVVGSTNNWGFTGSSDTTAKMYFIRLSNEFALSSPYPTAGVSGNGLNLADSSSAVDNREQEKLWAVIEQTEKMEWEGLMDSFTIELWVMWKGAALGSDTQVVISRGEPEGGWEAAHFAILYQTLGVPTEATLSVVAGCGNEIAFDFSGAGLILTGEWHHVALVVSGEEAQVYLDGEFSGSGLYSPGCFDNMTLQYETQGANSKIMIGSYGSEYGFNGEVDELRIWSTPRTQDQISSWMNRAKASSEESWNQNLVAYYQFNDVPSSQQYEFGYQYFASSTPYKKPMGLIQPDPTDKSRFSSTSELELYSVSPVYGVDSQVSSPFQNTIKLEAFSTSDEEPVFQIVEISPTLMALLEEETEETLMFAQPHNTLDLTNLPATLDSDEITVFVRCNSSFDPLCSSLPPREELWLRYAVMSAEGVETSAKVELEVEVCPELDECGTCMGDNSQCQCGCYHGFTAPFMDYTMFSFLLDENIAKIYDVLQTLEQVQERVLYRWQGGYQSADYTKYLYKQKHFTNQCLDPFCDVFNPFETEFEENLPAFRAADTDFDTCQCSQDGPETQDLPLPYSEPMHM